MLPSKLEWVQSPPLRNRYQMIVFILFLTEVVNSKTHSVFIQSNRIFSYSVRQKLLFIRINLLDTYNRKKMPRSLEFTDFERGMIIGLHLGEWHSFSEIAVILKCSKGAVQGVIERYKEDERTTVQPRSGRPQKFSDRDERQ